VASLFVGLDRVDVSGWLTHESTSVSAELLPRLLLYRSYTAFALSCWYKRKLIDSLDGLSRHFRLVRLMIELSNEVITQGH